MSMMFRSPWSKSKRTNEKYATFTSQEDSMSSLQIAQEGEEPSNGPAPIIAAIYTEDPLQEPQPEKIHIRGVDDMHTNDIRAFANDHFPSNEPSHIQWIDDTSANIIYPSREVALQAIL